MRPSQTQVLVQRADTRKPNAARASSIAGALGGVAAQPAEPVGLGRFYVGALVAHEREHDAVSAKPSRGRTGRGDRDSGPPVRMGTPLRQYGGLSECVGKLASVR